MIIQPTGEMEMLEWVHLFKDIKKESKLLFPQSPQFRRTDWKGNNLLRHPPSSIVTHYQNPLLYKQSWKQPLQMIPYSRNKNIDYKQQYYQSKRLPTSQLLYTEKNHIVENKERQMLGQIGYKSKGRSLQSPDVNKDFVATDDSWEHHYAHRDRRDLYQRIETTSPL